MAYKHYAPACKTAYFKAEELEQAKALYIQEESAGGTAYFLAESNVVKLLADYKTLDLGGTGEQMAQRLYAQLRKGEKLATLLIGIEPTAQGGVMDGVLNRMTRAFGRNTNET